MFPLEPSPFTPTRRSPEKFDCACFFRTFSNPRGKLNLEVAAGLPWAQVIELGPGKKGHPPTFSQRNSGRRSSHVMDRRQALKNLCGSFRREPKLWL